MDIKGIAQIAGVSPATVSKVINHKDSSISEKTRRKVLDVVKRYHYVPYSSTVSQQNAGWMIAVILRGPVSFDSTLDGIIQMAQSRGYVPLVFDSYYNQEQEEHNVDIACSSKCAGIIWEPVSEASSALLPRFEQSIPYLLIGQYGGSRSLLQPYFDASYSMTSEFITRGHSLIGCLLSEGRRTEDFLAGYKHCLEDNGLPYRDDLVFHEIGQDVADKVTTHEVTAVISSHFRNAVRFCQLMSTLQYRIPADVSLISLFSDDNAVQIYPDDIEVSTYSVHNSDFGSFLCNKLLDSIEGDDEPPSFVQHFKLENTSTVAPPPREKTQKVLVVGSLHIDHYMLMPSLPREGVTAGATATQTCPGGKAANEAVGVAKLGHRVAVIGNVGADFNADMFYREFKRWDIDCTGVRRIEDAQTGQAFIFTDIRGESMISILSAANSKLTAEAIRSRVDEFKDVGFCLVQTEIPLAAVEETCRIAREQGIPTILKPSSCAELPASILALVDYLVPNERELDDILPGPQPMEEKTRLLLAQGPKAVIVTLGSRGCYLCSKETERYYNPSGFHAVDDTGAGDAFVSTLVSYLLYGAGLDEAIRIANYAAGYSVTKHGVISSLIDRFSLETALANGSLETTDA